MKKRILLLIFIISSITFGATLPQGTMLTVSNDSVISSDLPVGSIIPFNLEGAIKLSDGKVIPIGSKVFGKITQAERGGHLRGKSELMLTLNMIQIDGFNHNISTNSLSFIGESEGRNTVGTVAKTSAIGGLAGALSHDAGKGAGIGAVVGLAGSMLGRNSPVGANPGTIYNFDTTVNIEI